MRTRFDDEDSLVTVTFLTSHGNEISTSVATDNFGIATVDGFLYLLERYGEKNKPIRAESSDGDSVTVGKLTEHLLKNHLSDKSKEAVAAFISSCGFCDGEDVRSAEERLLFIERRLLAYVERETFCWGACVFFFLGGGGDKGKTGVRVGVRLL